MGRKSIETDRFYPSCDQGLPQLTGPLAPSRISHTPGNRQQTVVRIVGAGRLSKDSGRGAKMPFKKFAQLLRMGSARKSPVIETYITQPAFALRLGAKPGFGTRPSEIQDSVSSQLFLDQGDADKP